MSHAEGGLAALRGGRPHQQAQQAPQLAAPVHHHHVGRHYARPIGGSAAALASDSPTTFSAYAATLSVTFAVRLLATFFAFASAWSRVAPIARSSYSVARMHNPIAAPIATAIAPAASGFSCTNSSTVVVALLAALLTRRDAERADEAADCAYSFTVSRALAAY